MAEQHWHAVYFYTLISPASHIKRLHQNSSGRKRKQCFTLPGCGQEIMEFYHVTGSIDFIMRIAVKNMKEWKTIFNRLIKMPGLPHYETQF